jgi:hypothetical protein
MDQSTSPELESVMAAGMSAEETARAADEMWAGRNDPDLLTGEVVELEGSSSPTSSVVVSVRLNSKELGEIERAANAAGMGISTYMKHAAMTTARDSSRISRAEVLDQLAAMGARISEAVAAVTDSVSARPVKRQRTSRRTNDRGSAPVIAGAKPRRS